MNRHWASHVFRIATLVLPSWFAWFVAFTAPYHSASGQRSDLVRVVTAALGPLWVLLGCALIVRLLVAIVGRIRGKSTTSALAELDVLTAAGSALAWTSAAFIMLAVWIGWASIAVVGLLGTGLFHAVVLHSFVALRRGTLGRGTIVRRFTPEVVVEGDKVVEELSLSDVHIPVGYRLFLSSRIGPRWPVARNVLEGSASNGEVTLENDVGPAIRGEHEVEPLRVWLQDSFGLCRSPITEIASTRLTVLPRLQPMDKTAAVVTRGIGPNAARPASRFPTEGIFDIREYRSGDDIRRIHWVRSLMKGQVPGTKNPAQLIVRMPDEIPPDRPRVRLVLDTFFPEVFALNCDAPSQLLDSLVSVWLAMGRALVESGVRVTLVAAMPKDGQITPMRHELQARAMSAAQKLGAQIVWQNKVWIDKLVSDEVTFVVARSVSGTPPEGSNVRWIVVQSNISPELPWPFASASRHLQPMGSSDNRLTRRRSAIDEFSRIRADHARAVLVMQTNDARPPPGSFIAIPPEEASGGSIRLEAIQ